MAEHYYLQSRSKHLTRRIIRRLIPALGILLVVLVGYKIMLRFSDSSNTLPQTSGIQASVRSSSKTVFRTPYFQFQATDTWREVSEPARKNIYTYRAYRGPLIEQDLQVYVNTEPEDMAVTRTLPVKISESGLLQSQGTVSDHCKTVVPPDEKGDVEIVLQDVSILCDSDGALYTVAVGLVGGTPQLRLTRPGKERVKFVILYRDLTISPTARDLPDIVQSFQTR